MRSFFLIVSFLMGSGILLAQQSSPLPYKSLSANQFKQQIDSVKGMLVIDVRTADEFSEGHLPGAVNIDVNDDRFMMLIKQQVSNNQQVALYCRSGRRSKMAAMKMAQMQLDIIELSGGILAWKEAGFPVSKDSSK